MMFKKKAKMSHKRKGQLTTPGVWHKHLDKFWKRDFWKRERGAEKKHIKELRDEIRKG